MALIAELIASVGIEPPVIREAGKEVANPNAGQPGPLDGICIEPLTIKPSAEPVNSEEPEAVRIVPGTRQVEASSQSTIDLLIESGLFIVPLFPEENVFPEENLFPAG